MNSTHHTDILDLLHRSRKLREAGERLFDEAAELAAHAEELMRARRMDGEGSRSAESEPAVCELV